MTRAPVFVRQCGFTLVAALFLIVVLAALGIAIVEFSAVQRQTVNLALKQTQAYFAAKSGLEYAFAFTETNYNQATPATACANAPLTPGGNQLTGITITVTCSGNSQHTENGKVFTVYQYTSVATYGTYGQPDYVSRTLNATMVQP
jgi:MSHA biogenesis protein MshP